MHKLVRQHLMWVWVAMLGLVFGALAPAVSHAMAASNPAGARVEVCTMEGMKTIVVDREQPAGGATADHLFEHCPYCTLHGGAALPPPSLSPAFILSPAGDTHPPLFFQAARPLFQWSAANPRAPPAQD